MNLGFIGTGEITKAVVEGIIKSNLKYKKIYLSKRNTKISSTLKRQSKKIEVLKFNQDIIDKSNWIFLGVTPEVGKKIIKGLKFKNSQKIRGGILKEGRYLAVKGLITLDFFIKFFKT